MIFITTWIFECNKSVKMCFYVSITFWNLLFLDIDHRTLVRRSERCNKRLKNLLLGEAESISPCTINWLTIKFKYFMKRHLGDNFHFLRDKLALPVSMQPGECEADRFRESLSYHQWYGLKIDSPATIISINILFD